MISCTDSTSRLERCIDQHALSVTVNVFLSDELPQTVIVKDNSSIKEEPGEALVTKSEPDIPPPPLNLIIKDEVKKKEDDEGRAVGTNDPVKDEPCTKMTMRLRRNLSNAQFVSVRVPGC